MRSPVQFRHHPGADSVFIPCCFLSGVSGQFFRQFAVTIAVSTIISAINALTMTPSRAVLIFKTEEGKAHGHKREALPWWIFAILGGIVTVWLGPEYLTGRLSLQPVLSALAPGLQFTPATGTGGEKGGGTQEWIPWLAVNAVYFIPGPGRRPGRFAHHSAGECRAGVVLPRF